MSYDDYNLYLINFKSVIPEVIQKIEIINNNEIKKIYNNSNLLKFLDCFNDDSIYINITQNNIYLDSSFYDITNLIQFKIIEGELREISRIEIERKKIEEKEKKEEEYFINSFDSFGLEFPLLWHDY